MSRYVYQVRCSDKFVLVTNLRTAKAVASESARDGGTADVFKYIADDDGKLRTNLGLVHTSFPTKLPT